MSDVQKGEGPGHPFRGNQYARGKGGRAAGGGVPTYQVEGGGRITRADAAERMYGTGSPQHKKAIEMDRRASGPVNELGTRRLSNGKVTTEHRIRYGDQKWAYQNKTSRDKDWKKMRDEHMATGRANPPKNGKLMGHTLSSASQSNDSMPRYGGKPNPMNGSKLPPKGSRPTTRSEVLDFGNGRKRWSAARRAEWERRRAPNPQVAGMTKTLHASLPPTTFALSRTLAKMDAVNQALWRARLRIEKGEAKGHPFRGNQFVTSRSNAGGAVRGKDRAAQVHALNEARRKKRSSMDKPDVKTEAVSSKKPKPKRPEVADKGKPEDPGAKGRANARSHGGNAYGPGGKPDSSPEGEKKKRGK